MTQRCYSWERPEVPLKPGLYSWHPSEPGHPLPPQCQRLATHVELQSDMLVYLCPTHVPYFERQAAESRRLGDAVLVVQINGETHQSFLQAANEQRLREWWQSQR